MRILHPRSPDLIPGPAGSESQSQWRGNTGSSRWQSMSLHRLCPYHRECQGSRQSTAGARSISPVGENKTRIDAREKVTGAAIFADDIQFGNGLLHARIKRSPHPHALIKRLDVSKALALPGVKAVVTGEDFPGYIGLYLQDRYIFCRDRVRYVGDPVAGVAATSEEIAEKALALIKVEYEILEPVLDPELGVSDSAP